HPLPPARTIAEEASMTVRDLRCRAAASPGGHAVSARPLTMQPPRLRGAMAAACAMPGEPNPVLDGARMSYRALQDDEQVARLAPDDLAQAGLALQMA